MKIRDVLAHKGSTVHALPPEAPLTEALEGMNRHRIGCFMVMDSDGTPQGILSERDILRHVAENLASTVSGTVQESMTPRAQLIIATEDDDLDYAMRVMTENRVRHLPVVGQGKVVGVVSIGDLLKSQLTDKEHENKMLQDYITGRYPG